MAVETGVAEFGAQGTYGVITKDDTTRLVRMAILGAFAHPGEGYTTRQLIRRMLGFFPKPDLVMLAELMKEAQVQEIEWLALAHDVMTKAGL